MPNRIFILGFMGSGKTYLGRRLAIAMGYLFVDLDAYIVQHESQSIAQLFENKGETYFRKIEADLLRLISQSDRVVVSCGGGTPCFHDNMAWMNAQGLTVWLNPSVETLRHRLQRNPGKRPLLQGLGDDDQAWDAFIEKMLAGRQPYYRNSAITYVPIHETADHVEAVLSLIKNHQPCTAM
jgi:shikimate kinase